MRGSILFFGVALFVMPCFGNSGELFGLGETSFAPAPTTPSAMAADTFGLGEVVIVSQPQQDCPNGVCPLPIKTMDAIDAVPIAQSYPVSVSYSEPVIRSVSYSDPVITYSSPMMVAYTEQNFCPNCGKVRNVAFRTPVRTAVSERPRVFQLVRQRLFRGRCR